MKKIALLLLISALTVTLASCGSDEGETTTASTAAITPANTTAETTTTLDNSEETTAPVTTNSAETTDGAETSGDASESTAESTPETTEGEADSTTAPETTEGEADSTTPETTEGEAEPTTPAATEGETTTQPETSDSEAAPATPETPEAASISAWEDNNDVTRYEITANADGTVSVSYAKEPASESQERYGYEGASWANMKADITGIYTGQSKFVIKVQGESGKSFMVKVFDDQAYQQEITFNGQEQEITVPLNNVKEDANMVVILFGDSGKPDVTGTFTILEAYFAD